MTGQVDDTERTTTEPPRRGTGGSRFAAIVGIVIGALMILGGIAAWIGVTTQLAEENIVVSDDAAFAQGQQVLDPITAWAQAEVIQKHALEATGGKTYAELDQDDPVRATVMNASFLRASLFTSVVAYGVALFAFAMGIVSILFGKPPKASTTCCTCSGANVSFNKWNVLHTAVCPDRNNRPRKPLVCGSHAWKPPQTQDAQQSRSESPYALHRRGFST